MSVLKDGYQTLISFSLDADVQMWEKQAKMPARTGGGPIDTTTMHNTDVRTKWPKALAEYGQASMNVAYDPDVIDEIDAMHQQNQEITVTLPDGATFVFWGWIEEFDPEEFQEGEQPMASVVIEVSNLNNSDAETKPVYTTGTTTTAAP